MADQNIARSLAKKIGKSVYANQRGKVSGLKGKTVRRVGTLLRVIEVNSGQGTITVNKVGEPANVVAKHNIKSFMSKKVEIVDPPGRPPKESTEPPKSVEPDGTPRPLDRAIDAATTTPSKSEADPATTTKDVAPKNRRRKKKQRKRIRSLVRAVGPEILKGYL